MIASEIGEDLKALAEEHARVIRQLNRLLAHGTFRNSRRCQAFLRYVVEEKLQGNSAHLKERMIGVSVFHQPLDYDTNANSVVRVTAGEVRRRLGQYYAEADCEDEILIALPLGSYVPEFRPREAAVVQEITSLEPPQDAPSVSRATRQEASATAVHTANAPTDPVGMSPRKSRIIALLLGCALLLLTSALLVALVTSASSRLKLATSESDRIWKGAFSGENVLLCAGSLDAAPGGFLDAQEPAAIPGHLGFSYTTAKTAAVIGAAIGHSGGAASLLPAQDTKVEDLQRSPAVLIGAFNNEWTMRLQSPLRYQFLLAPKGAANEIVDTRNPGLKRFVQDSHSTRDYAIFAHFRSPTTGQSTVLAAGLSKHGTAAVRIFLSSPELLKQLSMSAPRGWEKGNYEIVLASDLVNNLADPPRIVETYFW